MVDVPYNSSIPSPSKEPAPEDHTHYIGLTAVVLFFVVGWGAIYIYYKRNRTSHSSINHYVWKVKGIVIV